MPKSWYGARWIGTGNDSPDEIARKINEILDGGGVLKSTYTVHANGITHICGIFEYQQEPVAEAQCYFVECRRDGNFLGLYTAPSELGANFLTADPKNACRYTKSEALAVVQALNFFSVTAFRYSWSVRFYAPPPEVK